MVSPELEIRSVGPSGLEKATTTKLTSQPRRVITNTAGSRKRDADADEDSMAQTDKRGGRLKSKGNTLSKAGL